MLGQFTVCIYISVQISQWYYKEKAFILPDKYLFSKIIFSSLRPIVTIDYIDRISYTENFRSKVN